MAKKVIGKIAIFLDKYGEKRLARIMEAKDYGKTLHLKDVYGNKLIFGKDEVEIIEEMTEDILYPFIIKDIIKENMIVEVKEKDMPIFLKYAAMAGYTTGNPENLGFGTFYLYNGSIYHNAPTPKKISFDTLYNRIYNCGAIKIEEDMVEEFNHKLEKLNTLIRLLYVSAEEDSSENHRSTNSKCVVVLSNPNMIESYFVTPKDEFYKLLEEFFAEKGIKNIHYNNTRSTFWAANGFSRRDFYFGN